ncbi:MAG: phage tail protein [Oxalobacter sp.]|nr:phage tail protein [Oxalobacter sp.]
MMMCLGMFVFSLSTLAYQNFQRQTEWKFASNSRVGTRNAYQFTGQGDDTITLSGWFAPEFNGSPLAINLLRGMGDTGQAWMLVEGTGRIYGKWIITGISEGRTYIGANGAGKRIEFTLNLKCVDDDPNAVLGDLRDVLNKYLPDGFSLPDIPKIPDISGLL